LAPDHGLERRFAGLDPPYHRQVRLKPSLKTGTHARLLPLRRNPSNVVPHEPRGPGTMTNLEELLTRIKGRLGKDQYRNEAAISTGIVLPILRALGWDDSDPEQVAPEFSSGRGRVDFALFGTPMRGAVFVEVKGIGRSDLGDKQLFEYAFHEGIPLCILTDG
jgi:hypothetical protein